MRSERFTWTRSARFCDKALLPELNCSGKENVWRSCRTCDGRKGHDTILIRDYDPASDMAKDLRPRWRTSRVGLRDDKDSESVVREI